MKATELTKKKALSQYWKIMRRVVGRKRPIETEEETILLDSLEATIRAFDV